MKMMSMGMTQVITDSLCLPSFSPVPVSLSDVMFRVLGFLTVEFG